jgi:hypothetical protein
MVLSVKMAALNNHGNQARCRMQIERSMGTKSFGEEKSSTVGFSGTELNTGMRRKVEEQCSCLGVWLLHDSPYLLDKSQRVPYVPLSANTISDYQFPDISKKSENFGSLSQMTENSVILTFLGQSKSHLCHAIFDVTGLSLHAQKSMSYSTVLVALYR